MNEQLQNYARKTLKEGLSNLPEEWQTTFKLMYARNKGLRSVEDATAMKIDDVVDKMSADKLDWAMSQVENSLRKLDVIPN